MAPVYDRAPSDVVLILAALLMDKNINQNFSTGLFFGADYHLSAISCNNSIISAKPIIIVPATKNPAQYASTNRNGKSEK